MKIKIIAVAVTCFIMSLAWNAKAEEKPDLKLKSTGLAVVLGVDPIPGDALLYADKPVQATVNFIIGGLGGVLFWTGLIGVLTEEDSTIGGCDPCGISQGFMFVGALAYFPALLWDAGFGIAGVQAHNERVKDQTGLLKSIRPTFAVLPNGGYAGLEMKF